MKLKALARVVSGRSHHHFATSVSTTAEHRGFLTSVSPAAKQGFHLNSQLRLGLHVLNDFGLP